ncbi:MAG: hypothetical protein WD490_01685 [Opitutales bacterium]
MRALIVEARRRRENLRDYAGSLTIFQEMIAPVFQEIREAEHTHGVHSEFVMKLLEWLPEAFAFAMTRGEQTTEAPISRKELTEAEKGLVERVLQLMESILRMGVTEHAPCYDKTVLAKRLPPVLELARIVSSLSKPEIERETK